MHEHIRVRRSLASEKRTLLELRRIEITEASYLVNVFSVVFKSTMSQRFKKFVTVSLEALDTRIFITGSVDNQFVMKFYDKGISVTELGEILLSYNRDHCLIISHFLYSKRSKYWDRGDRANY